MQSVLLLKQTQKKTKPVEVSKILINQETYLKKAGMVVRKLKKRKAKFQGHDK